MTRLRPSLYRMQGRAEPVHSYTTILSEGKIVLHVTRQEIGSSSRSRRRQGSTSRLCSGRSRCGYGGFYLPSADPIEPTILPLVGINIERDLQVLPHLNVELGNLVGTKHLKTHPARILTAGTVLNHIFLSFPFVACSVRHSPLCGEHSDDFSYKFHCPYF